MHIKKPKSIIMMLVALILVIVAVVVVYPKIEFTRSGKLYACRFSDDFSEFEENPSYNERYFYNERHDISLHHFEASHFLWFYVLSFDYVEGDFRQTQFMLEADYIDYWLQHAVIEENESHLDVAAIIANKTAIVSNSRYLGNEYDRYIAFVLDGQWDTLSVFESDGFTVIQVGSPDECPRYIAYR